MRQTIEFCFSQVKDAPAILELQRLAYHSEALLYGDFKIPPLCQTLQELETEMQYKTFFSAWSDRLVGSVRANLHTDICQIERLIVHPTFQGQGIGTHLIAQIEKHFSSATRFELFTGHKSERNLKLYERLGFVRQSVKQISSNLSLIYLEKRRLL